MTNSFIKILITLSLIVFFNNLNAQRSKELRKRTNQIILYDTNLPYKDLPGMAMGMIDVDSTYYVYYGSANQDSTTQITEHTIFEIGSMSKIFTMSLLSIIANEGHLKYSDFVNDLLPKEYKNPNADSLRLSELVNHTSGLPLLPSDFGLYQKNPNNPFAHYTKKDLLAYYGTWKKAENEQEYVYSHINYALIEIILEHQMQRPFSQLLDEYLINPFGLQDTYIDINEKVLSQLARGYSHDGSVAEIKEYASFAGDMGIKTSLHDLLILMRVYLKLLDNEEKYSNILIKNVEQTQSSTLHEDVAVGMAWHIIKKKKYYNIIAHLGKVEGYQCSIHFVPETQTAMVILSNADMELENLGYMMLALVNNHWRKKRKDKIRDRKNR